VLYADASALVKLVAREHETLSLRRYLRREQPTLVTSAIARLEVLRAVRLSAPGRHAAVSGRRLFDQIALVALDDELLDDAVGRTSARVRTLDAIHLASALRIRARTMLVYDRRLAEAAEAAGLETIAPGA
jgi:predicted nucleic acid-binding protein